MHHVIYFNFIYFSVAVVMSERLELSGFTQNSAISKPGESGSMLRARAFRALCAWSPAHLSPLGRNIHKNRNIRQES